MSAVTMQELELEHAELLPARETLWVPKFYPSHFYPGSPYPVGSVHPDPGGPVRTWASPGFPSTPRVSDA